MPMLCIGMQCVTLYILLRRQCGAGVTRSVTNGIPTRSVRNDRCPEGLRICKRFAGETTRHATIDHTTLMAEQDYSLMVD